MIFDAAVWPWSLERATCAVRAIVEHASAGGVAWLAVAWHGERWLWAARTAREACDLFSTRIAVHKSADEGDLGPAS